jgi:HAD superfamily hydrolase (TIGR01490 family)
MGRPAAFFDLDGTLVTINGGRSWIERERRLGRLSRLQLARGAWFLGLYYFGLVNIERALSVALGTVEGEPEEVLRSETATWFAEDVVQHCAQGAWAFLEAHRALGHPLVLVTSSSPYAAALAKDHFHLDDALSTEYVSEGGLMTGSFGHPACYGAGKITHVEEWASRHDVDVSASYFYTDSNTDLPLLERVAHPRPVAPDMRLSWQARRRGWSIMDWSVDVDPASTRCLAQLTGQ